MWIRQERWYNEKDIDNGIFMGQIMNKSIYYIILDIGFTYEKGNSSKGVWHFREKNRINDEIYFWKQIVENIKKENLGIDCRDNTYKLLQNISKKYNIQNYKNIILHWDELQVCDFVVSDDIETSINSLISDFLEKAINENNKERKYNFIRALHNLPKCMHGCNCIQSGFKPISYEDAIKYSSWV